MHTCKQYCKSEAIRRYFFLPKRPPRLVLALALCMDETGRLRDETGRKRDEPVVSRNVCIRSKLPVSSPRVRGAKSWINASQSAY